MTEPHDEELTLGTPETLTGAQVQRIREAYRLGRSELAIMCGFPSTGVRIHNIEKKDSWKEGDRERVHAVLMHILADPPRDKKTHRVRGQSAEQRAEHLTRRMHDLGPTLIDPDEDDGGLVVHEVGDAPGPAVSEVPPGPAPTPIAITIRDGIPVLTNSEVSVWQRCRRKWWLGVYRQLAMKVQDFTGHRARGSRVHRALAAWYVPEGQERTDPREALERAIVEDWTAIVAQERQRPSYIDDDSLAELSVRFNDAVSLDRAMVEGYMEWVVEQGDDANLRVTAPEALVGAVIEGEVAGEPVRVQALGLLDVRVRRVADGVRLFEDHKTVGNLQQKRKTLHMDPQMLHYHLLEWLNTPEGEARCDGALYNMIRRSKRTAQAKPPFYERVEVHHNAYELDAYRRRLLGAARDIQRAERELSTGADPMSVVYPNPTDNCSWDCEFFAVCSMFEDGSRVEDAIAALYHVQDPMARYDLVRNKEEV